MFNLSKIELPLEVVVKNANLILNDISPWYEYQEGKKTDKLLGYRYQIVEDDSYDKFSVRVKNLTPLMTVENFQATRGKKYLVQFTNAIGKFYQGIHGEYDISFTADSISIIKGKEQV